MKAIINETIWNDCLYNQILIDKVNSIDNNLENRKEVYKTFEKVIDDLECELGEIHGAYPVISHVKISMMITMGNRLMTIVHIFPNFETRIDFETLKKAVSYIEEMHKSVLMRHCCPEECLQ